METAQSGPQKSTVSFLLITAFLNLAGIGILNPVFPSIVDLYAAPRDAALANALLFTSFSLCQFIFVPTLGALSDRYGRRLVMLISLFGSAIGYLVFGIGGALWVLFLGRIIDGITGGNLATIYAYAADISTPQDRTRFFGLIGAVSGLGFVFGPALGGLIYRLTGHLEAPVYFAAGVTFLNTVWGYFVMPESLAPDKRATKIALYKLNPFTQLVNVFKIPQIRLLLFAVFIWALSFAMLQSNLNYLTKDHFGWTPDATALLFFMIGIVSIITQGVLIPRLLPLFGESKIAIGGLILQLVGFVIIALSTAVNSPFLILLATLFVPTGNGLIIPSLTGLLSQSVTMREQGRVQGGNQSAQALARVVGPLWAGWTYTSLGHASPYLTGAMGLGISALIVVAAVPALTAHKAAMAERAPEARIKPLGQEIGK